MVSFKGFLSIIFFLSILSKRIISQEIGSGETLDFVSTEILPTVTFPTPQSDADSEISCGQFLHFNENSKSCQENTCYCPSGTPVPNSDCLSNRSVQCQSCKNGQTALTVFSIILNRDVIYKCVDNPTLSFENVLNRMVTDYSVINYGCPSHQIWIEAASKCIDAVRKVEITAFSTIYGFDYHQNYTDSKSLKFLQLELTLRAKFKDFIPELSGFTLNSVVKSMVTRRRRSVEADNILDIKYKLIVGSISKLANSESILAKTRENFRSEKYDNPNSFLKSYQFTEDQNEKFDITDFNNITNCATKRKFNDQENFIGNTCDLTEEKITLMHEYFTSLSKTTTNTGTTEELGLNKSRNTENFNNWVMVSIANQMESLQKATSQELINKAENKILIAEIQNILEQSMVKSERNLEIVSDDGLTKITTVHNISETVDGSFYVYDSDLQLKSVGPTRNRVLVPLEIFGNTNNNQTRGSNCSVPVSVTEQLMPNHLNPVIDDFKLHNSSMVVKTCLDKNQEKQLKKDIEIEFGALNEKNSGNFQNQIAECVYFDPEIYLWRSLGIANYDESRAVYSCKSNHLTYFSIIFREDAAQNNSKILKIFDLVCSFISVFLCLISFTLILLKKCNISRDAIRFLVALFLVHLLFIFGYNLTAPHFDDLTPCATVAGLTHWAILILFILVVQSVIHSITKFNFSWPIVELLLSPIVSSLVVGTIILITVQEPSYFFGGLYNFNKTYLNRQFIYGDQVFSFIDQKSASFYFGFLLFYVLAAIATVVLVMSKFWFNKKGRDNDDDDNDNPSSKKLIIVLPVMISTWLFFILMINYSKNQPIIWLFHIFKALQVPVIFGVYFRGQLSKLRRKKSSYDIS